jgi:spermidine synthase
MIPWEHIASTVAPDGQRLELKRRGREYLVMAGGHDLMSSEDEGSSRALADLGCAHIDREKSALVLVGGLGMGYTLRAALDAVGPRAVVEVSEFVPAVAEWNRAELSALAGAPLDDPRCRLHIGDVRRRIEGAAPDSYDAILLDIDNGPVPLAHQQNEAVYGAKGLAAAWRALRPGGVFGVWSFSDDRRFTQRLERQGFATKLHRVTGSRKGRGRFHVIWVAQRPVGRKSR